MCPAPAFLAWRRIAEMRCGGFGGQKMKLTKKILAALVLASVLGSAGCGAQNGGETAAKDTTPQEAAAEGTPAMEVAAEEAEAASQARMAADGGEAAEADHGSAEGAEDADGKNGKHRVAADDETVAPSQVVEEGMEPVYADALREGMYPVQVDSSSSMFRVTECTLSVKDGEMTALMTMSGDGYTRLYLGTAEEAAEAEMTAAAEGGADVSEGGADTPEAGADTSAALADGAGFIPAEVTEDGVCRFQVPVSALDTGIDCCAFSRRKEMWYDRVLVFRSDSLPQEAFAEGVIATAESLGLADGSYTVEVSLEGGSGRASVQSPASLEIRDGAAYATIVWSSANYDYMRIGAEKYLWSGDGDFSAFAIPVAAFDRKLTVFADTTAMSEPHEIEYTLFFDSDTIEEAVQ